jgi:HEAT repeat protein
MTPIATRISTAALLLAAGLLLPACQSQGEKDFNAMVNDAINHAGGEKPVDVAARLFDTGTPDARRAAIAVIQKKEWGHAPAYMMAYRTLATDPEPLVRGQAYRALGSSHDPAVALDLPPATAADHVLPGLITGLNDKDPVVRRDAAEAMCDAHNDALINTLVDHLRVDTDLQVRISCARALSGYASSRALMALAEALDDQDVAIIQYAYDALKATTGQQFEKVPQPWVEYIKAKYPAGAPS